MFFFFEWNLNVRIFHGGLLVNKNEFGSNMIADVHQSVKTLLINYLLRFSNLGYSDALGIFNLGFFPTICSTKLKPQYYSIYQPLLFISRKCVVEEKSIFEFYSWFFSKIRKIVWINWGEQSTCGVNVFFQNFWKQQHYLIVATILKYRVDGHSCTAIMSCQKNLRSFFFWFSETCWNLFLKIRLKFIRNVIWNQRLFIYFCVSECSGDLLIAFDTMFLKALETHLKSVKDAAK